MAMRVHEYLTVHVAHSPAELCMTPRCDYLRGPFWSHWTRGKRLLYQFTEFEQYNK